MVIIFYVSWSKFQSGKQKCNNCNKKNQLDYKILNVFVKKQLNITDDSEIKNIINIINKNRNSKFNSTCDCGNIFQISYTSFKNGKSKCNACVKNIRVKKSIKTHDFFVNEVNQLTNNEYIVVDRYIKDGVKISMKHKQCGHIWKVSPSNFLKGSRCPKCQHRNIRKTTSEFKEEVKLLVDEEYSVIEEYPNHKDVKIKFYHKTCNGYFEMSPHNFLAGQRCTICKESKGEKRLREILLKHNVNFKTQYSFEDCININQLRFDFAIFNKHDELKFLIEYDGVFHYSPIMGEKQLKYNQKMDNIKNTYCLNKNIKLIRIPYWDFDNIELILINKGVI